MIETGMLSVQSAQVQPPQGRGAHGQKRAEGFGSILSKHTAPADAQVRQAKAPSNEELPLDEIASAVAAQTIPVVQTSTPPEAEPQAVTDMEVNSVVIPAHSANQEDLLMLTARLAGVEGSDDFLRILAPHLQNILQANEFSQDMPLGRLEDIVADLLAGIRGDMTPPEVMGRIALLRASQAPTSEALADSPNLQNISSDSAIQPNAELVTDTQAEPTTVLPASEIVQEAAPALRVTAQAAPTEQAAQVTGEAPETDDTPQITAKAQITSETPELAPSEKPDSPETPAVKKADGPEATQAHAAPSETAPSPARQAAPAPEIPPVRQAMTQDIFDQIVKSAELRQAEGGTSLELELAPKFLGKLSLTLISTDDGIIARIKSGNAAVRNMLSADMQGLLDTLKTAGIDMKHIEIERGDIGWNFSGESKRGEQEFRQASGNPGRIKTPGITAAPQELSALQLSSDGSIYGGSALIPDIWGEATVDFKA